MLSSTHHRGWQWPPIHLGTPRVAIGSVHFLQFHQPQTRGSASVRQMCWANGHRDPPRNQFAVMPLLKQGYGLRNVSFSDFTLCGHHRGHLHTARWSSSLPAEAVRSSPLLLGCKPAQRVTVLTTVGRCNTVGSVCVSTQRKGRVKYGGQYFYLPGSAVGLPVPASPEARE